MLTTKEIEQALRASRVVELPPGNYHGPLGLEQLAALVAQTTPGAAGTPRVRRPIELDVKTWEKLERLARSTRQASSRPVSASEVAAAILEQAVAATPETE